MADIFTEVRFSKCFYLALGDGVRWALMAPTLLSDWLGKFGTILNLDSQSPDKACDRLLYLSPGNSGATDDYQHVSGDADQRRYYDNNTVRTWYDHASRDAICEVNNASGGKIELVNMWFSLQPIYQRSMSRGGLPFHAGLVERNGRGFLIAGYSNAGKSTCCKRFPEGWHALSDDETLIVRDPYKKYHAHPFPTWSEHLWRRSERTWDVQQSLPLSGIFFIEQAEQDDVEPIGEGQAATLISMSAMQVCMKFWRKWDKDTQIAFRQEIFVNACEIAKAIPAFRLRVSLNGRFWEKMEQAFLSGK